MSLYVNKLFWSGCTFNNVMLVIQRTNILLRTCVPTFRSEKSLASIPVSRPGAGSVGGAGTARVTVQGREKGW